MECLLVQIDIREATNAVLLIEDITVVVSQPPHTFDSSQYLVYMFNDFVYRSSNILADTISYIPATPGSCGN